MKIDLTEIVVKAPTQYAGVFAGQNDTVAESTHGSLVLETKEGVVYVTGEHRVDIVPVSNIARMTIKDKKADLSDVTAPEK